MRHEYQMWYTGKRKTVPSSFYGLIDMCIMDDKGWTLAEWEAQPLDWAEEMRIRWQMRAKAEAAEARKARAASKRR